MQKNKMQKWNKKNSQNQQIAKSIATNKLTQLNLKISQKCAENNVKKK